MPPSPVKQDRNYKISSAIINYLNPRWFRGKKILELGVGDGEILNAMCRLGVAEAVAIDARPEVLANLNKTFPHIKTIQCDLETSFPFGSGVNQFDLVISVDVLCHLKNWSKHFNDIMNIGTVIALETEVADIIHNDPSFPIVIPIKENNQIQEFSFSGDGTILNTSTIQRYLSNLGGKFKRIDETKLNSQSPNYRYDWVEMGSMGRNSSLRRLWMIRKDQFLVKSQQVQQELERKKEEIERAKLSPPSNSGEEKSTVYHPTTFNPLYSTDCSSTYQQHFLFTHKNLSTSTDEIIRVFFPYRDEQDINFCLARNLENHLINFIPIDVSGDFTFNFLFQKINQVSSENDVNIICSSNIFLDQTITYTKSIKSKELYALTPWHWSESNVYFENECSNQGAWVIRGKIPAEVNGEILFEKANSDNRIAYEFYKAGYKVFNPSRSIKTYRYGIRMKDSRNQSIGPEVLVLPTELEQ